MKKFLSILCVAIMMVSSISAQVSDSNLADRYPHMRKQYTIAFQPLDLYNLGWRFDFEKRIPNTPAWIQISAVINSMPRTTYDQNHRYENDWILMDGDELNRLIGGGLHVNYKYFFNPKETWYYAGGCSYFHYNAEYYDRYLRSFSQDNLVYYMFDVDNFVQKINKFGVNTYIGYQSPRPTFLFDIYFGLGYRYSFRSDSNGRLFNQNMFGIGYRGFVIITGVRFGVKFKQK
jgi:hypothetical protein